MGIYLESLHRRFMASLYILKYFENIWEIVSKSGSKMATKIIILEQLGLFLAFRSGLNGFGVFSYVDPCHRYGKLPMSTPRYDDFVCLRKNTVFISRPY